MAGTPRCANAWTRSLSSATRSAYARAVARATLGGALMDYAVVHWRFRLLIVQHKKAELHFYRRGRRGRGGLRCSTFLRSSALLCDLCDLCGKLAVARF